jgi:hypothetical protein
MSTDTSEKVYHVQNSPKCFRFKPEAFENHAPRQRGIYELVTFDESQNPTVLFVGAAFDTSIYDCLRGHFDGSRAPAADALLAKHPNLYFDYLERMDTKTQDDAQDVFWWLVNKHRPAYNDVAAIRPSGRTATVRVIEAD